MTEVPFKNFSYFLQKVQDAKGLEKKEKKVFSLLKILSFMHFLPKELIG